MKTYKYITKENILSLKLPKKFAFGVIDIDIITFVYFLDLRLPVRRKGAC